MYLLIKNLQKTFLSGKFHINIANNSLIRSLNIFKCFSTCPVRFDSTVDKTELEETEEFKNLKDEARFANLGTDHNLFVIQPFIKWGQQKKRNTTREFMLAESIALVKSIEGWTVTGSEIISLTSFDKKYFFGKGNLEQLATRVRQQKNITGVFVSVDVLKLVQQKHLQDVFQVPVFDRYMIVIQIFKAHATSSEAHLQIAIAELPYLWLRYRTIENAINMNISKEFLERKRLALMDREQKLKKALAKLKRHRALIRSQRKKIEFPIVAVVGYTNCGKTSLIKALTDDAKLIPRNQLFATLDVTVHEGLLPNNLKVLYVDTIGFISNIPTDLLEPFKITLEDAMLADLIIHVVDVSNPDYVQQKEHVVSTLEQLELEKPLLDNILVVGNKIDAIPSNLVIDDKVDHEVSAVKGTGLDELKFQIQNKILSATGRFNVKMRVSNGGPEYRWLMKNASVSNVTEDESSAQHLLLDVIMTQATMNKFKHEFVMNGRRKG